MEIATIFKTFISLIIVLSIILVIWTFIKKYSSKFQFGIFNKSNTKVSTTFIDAKNKIVTIELENKKYTVLLGTNNNLLLDKTDVF